MSKPWETPTLEGNESCGCCPGGHPPNDGHRHLINPTEWEAGEVTHFEGGVIEVKMRKKSEPD